MYDHFQGLRIGNFPDHRLQGEGRSSHIDADDTRLTHVDIVNREHAGLKQQAELRRQFLAIDALRSVPVRAVEQRQKNTYRLTVRDAFQGVVVSSHKLDYISCSGLAINEKAYVQNSNEFYSSINVSRKQPSNLDG